MCCSVHTTLTLKIWIVCMVRRYIANGYGSGKKSADLFLYYVLLLPLLPLLPVYSNNLPTLFQTPKNKWFCSWCCVVVGGDVFACCCSCLPLMSMRLGKTFFRVNISFYVVVDFFFVHIFCFRIIFNSNRRKQVIFLLYFDRKVYLLLRDVVRSICIGVCCVCANWFFLANIISDPFPLLSFNQAKLQQLSPTFIHFLFFHTFSFYSLESLLPLLTSRCFCFSLTSMIHQLGKCYKQHTKEQKPYKIHIKRRKRKNMKQNKILCSRLLFVIFSDLKICSSLRSIEEKPKFYNILCEGTKIK